MCIVVFPLPEQHVSKHYVNNGCGHYKHYVHLPLPPYTEPRKTDEAVLQEWQEDEEQTDDNEKNERVKGHIRVVVHRILEDKDRADKGAWQKTHPVHWKFLLATGGDEGAEQRHQNHDRHSEPVLRCYPLVITNHMKLKPSI